MGEKLLVGEMKPLLPALPVGHSSHTRVVWLSVEESETALVGACDNQVIWGEREFSGLGPWRQASRLLKGGLLCKEAGDHKSVWTP